MPTGFPDMRGDCVVGRAMAERSLEGRRRRARKGGETHPLLVKHKYRWGTSGLGEMYKEGRDGGG